MTEEEIDKMADDFVNAQVFTKVYGIARKAECGAFWKYGFLAGLKAGRPQWHDLRKNPNDLPKDDENFMCMLENGYRIECYCDPTSKRWYDNYFHHDTEYGYYQSKVIAWCEIPTFDKE